MSEARCPGCGVRHRVPEGEPLPRCRHCWSRLVLIEPVPPASSGPLFPTAAPVSGAGFGSRDSATKCRFPSEVTLYALWELRDCAWNGLVNLGVKQGKVRGRALPDGRKRAMAVAFGQVLD